MASNAGDIVTAVNFARQNNLRLVVKGGGHSYLGASNAPDSLLIWTRHLDELTLHDAFTPEGCEADLAPQPAVTVGAGAIWMHTYSEVTTKGGRYVQGGGCGTVGVAGLVQGGGFGTYMDPRLSDLEGILGLKTADMDVIRTGGPAVTDDVLGELVVSTRVLGSKEIMLLNHTGCGFTTFTDKELNDKFARETGDATPVPMRLFSFKDPEENTRAQIAKVRSHPWIAEDVPVRGFIFDVDTGRLREVKHG